MQETTNIHIGKLICEQLEKEGRKKIWLAEQVNKDPSSLCKTLKQSSIDSLLLLKISFALKHNFFDYLTNHYNSKI